MNALTFWWSEKRIPSDLTWLMPSPPRKARSSRLRHVRQWRHWKAEEVEAFDGNFLNRDDVARAVQGMDIVIFCHDRIPRRRRTIDAERAHEHRGSIDLFRASRPGVSRLLRIERRHDLRRPRQGNTARTTVRFRYRPTASANSPSRTTFAGA